MNPCCVLTGHFVPPTGHDPWTGQRHDYSPAENFQQQWIRWNRACYGANSASRILNAEGKIRDIVNNYHQLNFSVSPALLDELARSSPNVYRRFQEADASALARWGHGNALARPWREVILPLLPADRVELQIDWGLEAFRHHFGREPEGFCLPHDAVSPLVLDLLVSRGLKFLLLSASQAEGLMPIGSGSWQSLGGAPAPGDRPFRIDRPGGSIAVFFPDERLSRGLVQDHLLRDAGRLEGTLRQALQPTGFISLAAQAETFGLEEPFADMCLAALWERLGGSSPVDCSNYGHVLEHRPPRELVKLKKGQDEQGTSADCPHGVVKWQADCGCRTTASHQRWKQPLWNRMCQWEASLTAAVDRTSAELGVGPAALRQALPGLLLATAEPRPWARSLLGAQATAETENRLLAAARCLQWLQSFLEADLWDGDDPTVPRSRGGLLAALRVFDFAETPLSDFLTSLEPILVNDGRTVADFVTQEILRRRHDPRFAAALLLLDRLLRPRARYEDSLGPLSVADFSRSRHEIDEGVYRYTGHIRLHDRESDRDIDFDYLLLEDHREGVSLYLKEAESTDKPEAFDLQHLPVGDRVEIVHLMGNDLEGNLASETQAIFPLLRKSLVYARLLDVPPLPMARSLMELAVTRKILGMTEASEVPGAAVMESLEEELAFAKDFSLQLDWERLNERFSRWLAQALADPDTFTAEPVVKSVETLLAALGRWGFHPDLTVAQALVFEALRDRAPQLLRALEDGRIESLHELKRLLRLGSLLWLDTSGIKNRVLEL
jgi:hypothetical protein